jgi:hypothetical protein
MNGLVATRTLKRVLPQCMVVALTRHGDDAYLQELMRAGASAYVLKQSSPAELITAIRTCASGGQYLDSSLTARVTAGSSDATGEKSAQSGGTPSDRESEVLRLIRRRLQQQGDCHPPHPQREDGRSAQSQRDAEAWSQRPHRHCQIRNFAGLAEGRLGKIPRIIRRLPDSPHAAQPVDCHFV